MIGFPEHPLTNALLFCLASFWIIWRLEAMKARGLEGSAIGALVSPYCSGLGNLLFVVILVRTGGPGGEIIINSLVNNITNTTLLIGLPALIWGLKVLPAKTKAKRALKTGQLNRLALLLTTGAAIFFTVVTWLLGKDGRLDRGDGATLIVLFVFWQFIAMHDVLKGNLERGRRLPKRLLWEGLLVIAGGVLSYLSLEQVTTWLSSQDAGFFRKENIGWISAWLMVLPNALLALYYAAKGQPDLVLGSQLGDGHICIPLCIGLGAVLKPIHMPTLFASGVVWLLSALALHFLLLLGRGKIGRAWGALLLVAYTGFVLQGFG